MTVKKRDYQKSVNKFAEDMVAVLGTKRDQYPDDWEFDTFSGLCRHLREEIDEVDDILKTSPVQEIYNTKQLTLIINECADVGNIAMMISDNAKKQLVDSYMEIHEKRFKKKV